VGLVLTVEWLAPGCGKIDEMTLLHLDLFPARVDEMPLVAGRVTLEKLHLATPPNSNVHWTQSAASFVLSGETCVLEVLTPQGARQDESRTIFERNG